MSGKRSVMYDAGCGCCRHHRYDVGGRISCQLACYPGKGARYVRHTDASDSAPDRSVTALLYLNHQWDAQVGPRIALVANVGGT